MDSAEEQQSKVQMIGAMDWRLTNHKPTEIGIENIELFRNHAKDFANIVINLTQESRERSLALTKIEEALFWANAAVARYETDDLLVPDDDVDTESDDE
jgi:hypothetical protein